MAIVTTCDVCGEPVSTGNARTATHKQVFDTIICEACQEKIRAAVVSTEAGATAWAQNGLRGIAQNLFINALKDMVA